MSPTRADDVPNLVERAILVERAVLAERASRRRVSPHRARGAAGRGVGSGVAVRPAPETCSYAVDWQLPDAALAQR